MLNFVGASSGVGFDTSHILAGASPRNHVLMGVRNMKKGEIFLKDAQSRKLQGTVSLLELDVTSDESINAAAKKIETDFGRLDVLVNNAGIWIESENPNRKELHEIFETNVFGPTVLSQTLTPLLKASKAPKIINVTSELGSIGYRSDPTARSYPVPGRSYRMSKAALNMLTACQYAELKEFGFKVWTFCPGYVITNLSGEGDRQHRKEVGAESSETSAQGILELVEGKRDSEVGKFVARYGQLYPW